jgi:hypothetical protein
METETGKLFQSFFEANTRQGLPGRERMSRATDADMGYWSKIASIAIEQMIPHLNDATSQFSPEELQFFKALGSDDLWSHLSSRQLGTPEDIARAAVMSALPSDQHKANAGEMFAGWSQTPLDAKWAGSVESLSTSIYTQLRPILAASQNPTQLMTGLMQELMQLGEQDRISGSGPAHHNTGAYARSGETALHAPHQPQTLQGVHEDPGMRTWTHQRQPEDGAFHEHIKSAFNDQWGHRAAPVGYDTRHEQRSRSYVPDTPGDSEWATATRQAKAAAEFQRQTTDSATRPRNPNKPRAMTPGEMGLKTETKVDTTKLRSDIQYLHGRNAKKDLNNNTKFVFDKAQRQT